MLNKRASTSSLCVRTDSGAPSVASQSTSRCATPSGDADNISFEYLSAKAESVLTTTNPFRPPAETIASQLLLTPFEDWDSILSSDEGLGDSDTGLSFNILRNMLLAATQLHKNPTLNGIPGKNLQSRIQAFAKRMLGEHDYSTFGDVVTHADNAMTVVAWLIVHNGHNGDKHPAYPDLAKGLDTLTDDKTTRLVKAFMYNAMYHNLTSTDKNLNRNKTLGNFISSRWVSACEKESLTKFRTMISKSLVPDNDAPSGSETGTDILATFLTQYTPKDQTMAFIRASIVAAQLQFNRDHETDKHKYSNLVALDTLILRTLSPEISSLGTASFYDRAKCVTLANQLTASANYAAGLTKDVSRKVSDHERDKLAPAFMTLLVRNDLI